MNPAGISTEMISQISSSGKGGWFMRVSKRQYPTLRHGENDESPLRTPTQFRHPTAQEMEKEIELCNSPKAKLKKVHTTRETRHIGRNKPRVKPLLLMTKPLSPESSKMFNYKMSSSKKKDLLNRLKEIKRSGSVTQRAKPFQNQNMRKRSIQEMFEYTCTSPFTQPRENTAFMAKRLSQQKPSPSHIEQIKPKESPHFFLRDLYPDERVQKMVDEQKTKDAKATVCSYLLFNGNQKTLTDHEKRYSDSVVNRPRKYSDNKANYFDEHINKSIRSFLTLHRSDAEKGIFDDLRPMQPY